ncbi:MAG: IPT/TIG domain-containing protein, partial [Nocardioidaceae bacterium]
LITITKTSAHRLPALTANQVIALTGTGFDEDIISGVAIDGCTTAPTYVVASPTSLLLKTADDCAVTAAAKITVTDTSSKTAVTNPAATGGVMALDFIAAPTLVTPSASVHPVVTLNSAASDFADQVTTAHTKGGTVIKVTAGGTKFVDSATYKLAASLGGVPLTAITMATGGNSFTGTVGAHAADAAPVLKVTSNGVTKSFAWDDQVDGTDPDFKANTHEFTYQGTSIAVAPATGPISGGTVLTITGSGFSAASGSATTVTVGGVSCPVTGTTLATTVKCTVAKVSEAGPATVETTTGSVKSVVSATSNYTFLDQ